MRKPAKISYTSLALRDLEEIFDYIALDSPREASKFVGRILNQISRLADFPMLGTKPRDSRLQAKGYRILVIEEYLVFYVLRRQTVRIRRVLHGARRYAFLV